MKITNETYIGANNRKSLVDFETPDEMEFTNIVVFVHGYKGYKDWGAWNLVQSYFISNRMAFCKFNLSHNGGTVDDPLDFPDLDAFSKNKYSYEMEDIERILDWLEGKIDISNKRIHLIGHSRGGGDVILAGKDKRVTSIVTWASISDIPSRFPKEEALQAWKENGFYTVKNGRTKQDMPHLYSFYEDWEKNKEELNIEKKALELKKPVLHIHGDEDEAVSITESEALSSWTSGKLIIISDANHTFGSYQPYKENDIPSKLHEACNLTVQFIERQ